MDGDAGGQVGGVDLGEGERRVLAGESRGWCCGVCAGSFGGENDDGGRRMRSNEDVLEEWRRGVCLERGVVVSEDGESERILSSEEQAGTQGQGDSAQQPESREVSAQSPQPTLTTNPPSSIPSQPQPQPQPPAAAPAPTPPAPPAQTQQATANTHSEDAWLDRAIVGVLIALVFMIMRRVMNSDDDYID